MLRAALRHLPGGNGMRLLLEFAVPRLGRWIDAVLLTPAAVVVIEFKVGEAAVTGPALAQVEGYALDLQDFHAGSRNHAILPILVATEAVRVPAATLPLMLGGVAPTIVTNRDGFAADLVRLLGFPSVTGRAVDVARWEDAPYRPVPNVIEAACRLYGRHDVAEIASARADVENLTRTAARIAAILDEARAAGRKAVLFVTGIPGAGKTLCGLNAAFAAEQNGTGEARATFLTGNPTLVHVLRAALVRSVAADAAGRRAAAHRMEGVIQALPRFRDHHVGRPDEVPAERVVVVDEAQRSWTAAHAVAKTRDRPVRLSSSEPAHLLDVMARHEGFAAMVCLVGGGQEIHDGEGGLACWGEALAERPDWDVWASGTVLSGPDARSRLPRLPELRTEPALHLDVAVRSLRAEHTPRWVEAVLQGDREDARRIAEAAGGVPFFLCRDLPVLRADLRRRARGLHRAGLVASAGAARLRAEGLGCELPHTDPTAVANWFLERWNGADGMRDVRASDALEVVGTQFSVQGLELDQVGLCWDGDLLRRGRENGGWEVRSFRGTRWQTARDPDKVAWRINTYRVLLTRARYDTVIWVPRGDPEDPSRDPALLDGVARFLSACGAREVVADGATAGRDSADFEGVLAY
ncbi:MAG: DUF2075 domain-containing protein [Gluconacetobacter diazotrophicus]|nr:DUF2075 domain-containing protein [Gluconacetobacter diazotrophicus]